MLAGIVAESGARMPFDFAQFPALPVLGCRVSIITFNFCRRFTFWEDISLDQTFQDRKTDNKKLARLFDFDPNGLVPLVNSVVRLPMAPRLNSVNTQSTLPRRRTGQGGQFFFLLLM